MNAKCSQYEVSLMSLDGIVTRKVNTVSPEAAIVIAETICPGKRAIDVTEFRTEPLGKAVRPEAKNASSVRYDRA